MPRKRKAPAPKPVRVRSAATRARSTPTRRKRAAGVPAAELRLRRAMQAVDDLHAQVATLRAAVRRARRELRDARAELQRLGEIEREVLALRRELGPQRPLLPLPDPPAVPPAHEPWMPAAVEAHLTVLHDQDVAALEGIVAEDVVVIEAPFADASPSGREAVAAWHNGLFVAWSDFRFMPRHWHNLGGAAFLEGEASFIQRGEHRGVHAAGRAVRLDMLLVYHLSQGAIRRVKLYYDAATWRRQVTAPVTQGELFSPDFPLPKVSNNPLGDERFSLTRKAVRQ